VTQVEKKTSLDTTRRTFLKATGFTALSALVAREANADSDGAHCKPDASSAPTAPSSLADLVNVLQGTESTFEFSRGNTLPIAALPFGMAHWTIQSHEDTAWMFQPSSRRIQGFRCTHQLSPWLNDYGHAVFLPFSGNIPVEPKARSSSYDVEGARLTPYSLQVNLLRFRAGVELVPSERCAIMSATFGGSRDPRMRGMLFDVPCENAAIETDQAGYRVRFKSTANAGGVPRNFATYYVIEFSEPCVDLEIRQVGEHKVGVVRFLAGDSLEARIGTSFISYEQAALNLERELGNASMASLREKAAARWNEHLGRIELQGGSLDQRRTFYSCLYRALLFPRVWHEPDARGEMRHFSAFSGKVKPGVMYADHGYWDLYRAWYPLMSILFPERLGEILQAWVNAYKEGGWLPQFPSPGYRSCMTGSLIDSVFADAAVKGIPGFDLAEAYEGMKKHATEPGDPAKGYGRAGVGLYLERGYVPADRISQSVAETTDAAYGDFCIAQVAKVLGRQQEYKAFLKRSENWRNVFDPQVKFLRGKNEDGSWVAPFDPCTWGSPYVEGAAWQHRWDVPHDLRGLIDAMGSDAAAVEALEQMMTTPPKFNVGVYGTEIHEMSEMAAVPFGQYAHSNQPVHHVLYTFAHAGAAERTQFWVRKVMQDLYTPDSFPGDEDTGSMSAWFILSALGFYPVCPGKAEYTLGCPLFSRATVRLPNRKALMIDAPGNNASTVFVESASLNGRTLTGHTVDHSELMEGGTLRFCVAAKR
jgi:predicted alpha-1,2-mannosidase